MNIREINKRHHFFTGFDNGREGISSSLLAIKNGIAFIRVVITQDYEESYKSTAVEIANTWKTDHPEFQSLFGCKIFIVDARKNTHTQQTTQLENKATYDVSLGLIYGEEQLN